MRTDTIIRNFLRATLAASICVTLAGCDKNESSPSSTSSTTSNSKTDNKPAYTPPADNTAKNKQSDSGKTPLDQGQNAADIKITADIRRAIMDDKAMSVNAQNCKVITEKGVVTLRGPVDSTAEKDSIEAKAKAVAGVVSVNNQLEIAPK